MQTAPDPVSDPVSIRFTSVYNGSSFGVGVVADPESESPRTDYQHPADYDQHRTDYYQRRTDYEHPRVYPCEANR